MLKLNDKNIGRSKNNVGGTRAFILQIKSYSTPVREFACTKNGRWNLQIALKGRHSVRRVYAIIAYQTSK